MPEFCPKCGRAPVLGCDGGGFISVEENEVRYCPNFRAMRIKRHLEALGPEVHRVQHVSKSPLFEVETGKSPTMDRTKDNLYLRCSWSKLLPHFKLVLGCTWNRLSYKVLTDNQIKNVFLGNEQYKSRPVNQREDVPVFNSLEDLVGEWGLLIIKLGYIGYPNKAAAGALKETLLIRESLHKAVWIVEDPERPWVHSYSQDVKNYVQEHFKEIAINPVDPGPQYNHVEEVIECKRSYEVTEDLGIDVHEVEPEVSISLPQQQGKKQRRW